MPVAASQAKPTPIYCGRKGKPISDGWPKSIDDSAARADWGWKHEFDLDQMTGDMLKHLGEKQ